MKQIETEIVIASKPERVWEVLTDFENHSEWNPFIKSISGEKKVGEKLTVFLQPPEGNGMTFKPVILTYDKSREFRWRGKLGIKGIFDGEHYFKLIDNGNGTTRFVHGEKFSGILVGAFRTMLKKTKEGFEGMNESIKVECEKYN